MKGVAAALLVTLAVAYVIITPIHALSCSDVDQCIEPCVFYLTKAQNGALKKTLNAPNPSCCAGVAQLQTLAKDRNNDRQSVCSCMQQAVGQISGFNHEAAANLPAGCGTSLPFFIASDFDCNSIL